MAAFMALLILAFSENRFDIAGADASVGISKCAVQGVA
jgi:hypothetical protein